MVRIISDLEKVGEFSLACCVVKILADGVAVNVTNTLVVEYNKFLENIKKKDLVHTGLEIAEFGKKLNKVWAAELNYNMDQEIQSVLRSFKSKLKANN